MKLFLSLYGTEMTYSVVRVSLGIAKWVKLNSVCAVNTVGTTAGALHCVTNMFL